jgi:hypothetical protein
MTSRALYTEGIRDSERERMSHCAAAAASRPASGRPASVTLASFVHRSGCVEHFITQPTVNQRGATVVLVGLIVRSFGLAAGLGLGILLAAAFFAH